MPLPQLKNKVMLQALTRQKAPYTPVWIMRQAGRYLPEYRQLRSKAGHFMVLCQTPEFATEATLQPIERFALDAAILFSDILTIPDALDLGLTFTEGEGPSFARPVRSMTDVRALPDFDMKRLDYVTQAIDLIQKRLDGRVPLIGFSGSPWTLAVYMVEGGSSKDFRKIKRMLYSTPSVLHELLERLTQAVTIYLNAQIEAGVDIVQIFDTWGGVLGHEEFQVFDCIYTKKVIAQLKRVSRRGNSLPVIAFSKGCGQWLEDLVDTGADALGLDWTMDMSLTRQRVAGRVALQGNIDPSVLYGSESVIEEKVKKILEAYGNHSGHVFNLGHGIAQDVEPEKLAYLVDCVHRLSRKD